MNVTVHIRKTSRELRCSVMLSEREARILGEIEEWAELCDPAFAELMDRLSQQQPRRRHRACRIMLALTLVASVLVLAWTTAVRGQPVPSEHGAELDVGSVRAVDAAPTGAVAPAQPATTSPHVPTAEQYLEQAFEQTHR